MKDVDGHDLAAIGAAFDLGGELVHAERHGSGHINDTFAATYLHGDGITRYVHQRINDEVFRDPLGLMDNVRRVTSHIRTKLVAAGVEDVERRVLTLIPKRDGSVYHLDEEGKTWRTYLFIERARTHDVVRAPELAYQAARAFGEFQRHLVDLPEPRLVETIPGFHDTPARFAALREAVKKDVAGRSSRASEEIRFAEHHEPILGHPLELQAAGEIPERAVHYDTKVNNVMIDEATGRGICVIDLDTVMPGLAPFDFGDLVRTATSRSQEDERDLSRVALQMPLFEALVSGYLKAAGSFLEPAEIASLVLAGKLTTLEIGIRFLTDYLAGDTYFRVHREGHNLDRCRAQLRLVESITEQEEAMERVVEEVASERPWRDSAV